MGAVPLNFKRDGRFVRSVNFKFDRSYAGYSDEPIYLAQVARVGQAGKLCELRGPSRQAVRAERTGRADKLCEPRELSGQTARAG